MISSRTASLPNPVPLEALVTENTDRLPGSQTVTLWMAGLFVLAYLTMAVWYQEAFVVLVESLSTEQPSPGVVSALLRQHCSQERGCAQTRVASPSDILPAVTAV